MNWSAYILVGGVCLTILGAGCSAQTDTDYSGEPLATLSGHVVTGEVTTDEKLVAAVVWTTRDGGVVGLMAATAPLQGDFPANFKLDLVQPPPPEAFHLDDNGEDESLDVAQGVIAAVPASRVGGVIKEEDIAGVAMDYGLIYFQEDAEFDGDPSWAAAHTLNVDAAPGYQLFSIKREMNKEYLECTHAGLCTKHQPPNAQDDYVFERCVSVLDDPITCTFYTDPSSDEEKAEDEECSKLWQEAHPVDGMTDCGMPWSWPKNEEGLNASITITMGKKLHNWLND